MSALRIAAASIAVLAVSAGSLAAIAAYDLARNVQANAIDIGRPGDAAPPAIGTFDGGFNLLVVGADNSADQSADDEYGERDATLNDVNILLHVSNDHTTAVAVSFPRDLIIAHPECVNPAGGTFDAMSARPLNEAIERGGLPCVVRTIENLTGLTIPYAGLVSFDAVIQMTDAIGGVPVCLTGPLHDENVSYRNADGESVFLDMPAGENVISGGEALGFLRSRHGVGDGSDLGRISSQQQYMSSLVRTIKSDSTLTNPAKLFSLATVASKNVKLSTTLSNPTTMIAMAQTLRSIDLDKLVFVQYPGATNDPDFPGKVIPVKAAADELFSLIAADKPFTLGADSQGVGTTAAPVDPSGASGTPGSAAPDASAPGAGTFDPMDPDSPDSSPPPNAGGTTVLDGVTGQTAQQQTCAIPNN